MVITADDKGVRQLQKLFHGLGLQVDIEEVAYKGSTAQARDPAATYPGVLGCTAPNMASPQVVALGQGVRPLSKAELAEADWKKRRPQVFDALDEVFAEVKRSLDKHGGFRSGHEGWAVLKEEVDELWDEIKADNSGGVEARTEAIQIAAMAVKYAVYIAGNSR